jgi:hypothetical protein
MNKVNPRGYLGRQDWLWWALTHDEHVAGQMLQRCRLGLAKELHAADAFGIHGRLCHWLTRSA